MKIYDKIFFLYFCDVLRRLGGGRLAPVTPKVSPCIFNIINHDARAFGGFEAFLYFRKVLTNAKYY